MNILQILMQTRGYSSAPLPMICKNMGIQLHLQTLFLPVLKSGWRVVLEMLISMINFLVVLKFLKMFKPTLTLLLCLVFKS